jgi:hypothetical protein
MKRLLFPSLFLIGLAILLTACTTPVKTAYKTIASTEATVDKVMNGWSAYVLAQRAKGVDVSQQEYKVKMGYSAYRIAANAATAAWATYAKDKTAGTTEAQAKLDAAIAACSELSGFVTLFTKQP